VDRSVEARLAALEAGSAAHFGYMQEAGLAIQALQTMVGGHEQRLDEANDACHSGSCDVIAGSCAA
jgi:hypothetical protein